MASFPIIFYDSFASKFCSNNPDIFFLIGVIVHVLYFCGILCQGMVSVGVVFHSFIHSGHFYSASSSPLLLRGAPDIAQILCWSFMPKCHRQLQVKDFPMWRPERDSNSRPFDRKATNLPMSHHTPHLWWCWVWDFGCDIFVN